MSPCRLQGVEEQALCGTVEVPSNPQRPSGAHAPVYVVVLPATGAHPRRDPIVPLPGGPGEASSELAADIAKILAFARHDRDILLVDQRGTGKSQPFACSIYSSEDSAANVSDVFPLVRVQECERDLAARGDPAQYTYRRYAADVENVRRALGYGPLNLFAQSYGTRVAQVFLKEYPESVRTLYMSSVVPIDVAMPLPIARAAQTAMERTLAACEADSTCSAAFPNVRTEFRAIMDRLDSETVQVSVPGSASKVTLQRGRVAEQFRASLYNPESAAAVPFLIHRAYLGDWAPIVQAILNWARSVQSASWAIFFNVTCNDDVAFLPAANTAPETKGTFLGDYRVHQQKAACARWPKVPLPPDYRRPVKSSVPALFVSGDADPGSPPSLARHVARGFPHRMEVLLPGQAHSGWSGCVARLYQGLLETGSVRKTSTVCDAVPRPPFLLRAQEE